MNHCYFHFLLRIFGWARYLRIVRKNGSANRRAAGRAGLCVSYLRYESTRHYLQMSNNRLQ